jgi:hypothetical protein
VDQHREEHGLNRCLEATNLPKSTDGDVSSPAYRKNRSEEPSEEEQELMDQIREIIQGHPDYGYRRILPELEERTGQRVNISGFGGFLTSMSWDCPVRCRSTTLRLCRRFSATLPGT